MSKTIARLAALFLAILMTISLLPVAAQSGQSLVVASTTALSGEFLSGMWGNNTADVDVRLLLHDYATVVWGLNDQALVNERAVTLERSSDVDGHAVFTFTLKPGLRFSDGSAITAEDYVFSVLLEASPLIRELGGNNVSRDHLKGAVDYQEGDNSVYSGLRLLSKESFSLTVLKEYLPYFYDLDFVHVLPYPHAVIAPGCTIRDEGQGAFIQGDFTADLLRSSLLDPDSGYLSHPKVTSGAYRLLSYDRAAKVATFQRNPYYLGNREGKEPAIQKLTYQEIRNEDITASLESGSVQLVNKISAGQVIQQVKALPSLQIASVDYARNGFGYLAFAVERPLMASQNLRAALSSMVDKDSVVQGFLQGYGQPVHAYYSPAQWMAKETGEEALVALNPYPFNLDRARELLEADGWTLNGDGQAFDPSKDLLRHRQDGSELIPLTLAFALPPENQAGDIALEALQTNLESLGGQLQVSHLPMAPLLRQFYRQDVREYDVLFLASNFGPVFDPYFSYQTGDSCQACLNTSGLLDEDLLALARDLRQTAPMDRAAYLAKWQAFQARWAELLPLLPLYSNLYVDGFTAKLRNYHPERYHSWAEAILYAQMD